MENLLHQKLLHILDFFIKTANAHKFDWFVDGGTLLGAIRNGKLIEWDDDIDICMPMFDFMMFSQLMHKNPHQGDIFFQDTITDGEYFNINARLRLDGTTCISEREKKLHSHKGIFIDIYPICYLPNDDKVMHDVIGFMRTLCKHTDVEDTEITDMTIFNRSETYSTLMHYLHGLDMKWCHDATHVGAITFARYSKYKDVAVSKEAYSHYKLKSLKGLRHKVRVPVGYDEILRLWYGPDYMTPSKEPAFHSSFIDINNDYHAYEEANEK